ncbi:MAG TPA: aspartyl/asparaginyl beta-hydroxylase domain-containing protein [Sphingomicrobium sp.]|jgi:hypothetical protein|nr:aspartyl/asparaginyl beta-hydroxylase domain-containing protein [Sphingomicrobium sp.]
MARGDVGQAASLLELAAQRGRDASTLLRLATIRRSVGDLPGAVQAAAAAVELAPRNFVMSLLLGSLREATGALHASERAYRVACEFAPFDLSFQPGIAIQLQQARAKVEAISRWRRRLFEWQPEDVPGLSADQERRLRQFRSNILDNLDAGPTAPPLFLVPGLRSRKYFDADQFTGIADVEAATDAMREEFLALIDSAEIRVAADASGSHEAEATSPAAGKWSMIPLIRNGMVVEEFASRCPVTMAVAKMLNQPKIGLISPSLYFSILEPGSRIPPHIGITSARAIAHFPLIVPNNCGFRVGGEMREWEVGKAMIFDDMTMHEAWNDSSSMRVVVIADLWRPELGAAERQGIEALMDCADVAEPN